MSDTFDHLTAYSDQLAALVERAAAAVVAVHGGGRGSTSGIHWRPGVIVTAEEALESDDALTVIAADGKKRTATLVGRDPTTDIAVLRIDADDVPVAELGDAAALRAGHLVLAVGRHEAGPVAAAGVIALAAGPWQSARGGAIDHLIRLGLTLSPAAEGGAMVDTQGRVAGMAVLGPRRRALAIPRSTIDRVVDLILAKGRVPRGYLGAGLQPVRQADGARGVLVVSIDPEGPATRAGLMIGDIIVSWNEVPVGRVRELMRLLGPETVGSTAALGLTRGGTAVTSQLVIAERPERR